VASSKNGLNRFKSNLRVLDRRTEVFPRVEMPTRESALLKETAQCWKHLIQPISRQRVQLSFYNRPH